MNIQHESSPTNISSETLHHFFHRCTSGQSKKIGAKPEEPYLEIIARSAAATSADSIVYGQTSGCLN